MARMTRTSTLTAASGARLTVDLGALARNWRTLTARAGAAETAAAVKADAYGIGIGPACEALAAAGCRSFFVALPEEGLAVRAVAPDAAVYVLAGPMPGTAPILAAGDLRPVLGSWPQIEAWASFSPAGAKPASAIHVDTGMNRLGLSLNEALHLARQPALVESLHPALIMSHLACADTPEHPKNAEQAALFGELRQLFPGLPASLANSAGIHLGPDYRFDLVRPGIALYGGAFSVALPPLEPVVTAEARVLQVRDAEAGETVGYGAAETLIAPTRLAIVAAGYADGYHRLAGSSDERPGARAFVRGRPVPLVGRVSMDLIALDVSGVPGVSPGEWVELIGPNAPLDAVAEAAGTIGYELLTQLGRRYARRYVG